METNGNKTKYFLLEGVKDHSRGWVVHVAKTEKTIRKVISKIEKDSGWRAIKRVFHIVKADKAWEAKKEVKRPERNALYRKHGFTINAKVIDEVVLEVLK